MIAAKSPRQTVSASQFPQISFMFSPMLDPTLTLSP
jgi:hypothetical protein